MKFLLAVGSYEKSIYGIEYILEGTNLVKESVSFALPVHTGSIKTISSCGKYLATGSTDETIRVFDLAKKRDIGTLTTHSGTVTFVAFVGNDMLATGAEDGLVCVFRCRDWEEVRRFKAHKHGVTALAVHPSGKLMLSIGKDDKLRMWDLARGKLACAKKAPIRDAHGLAFSPDGSLYVCFNNSVVGVFKGDECTFRSDALPIKSVHCAEFVDKNTLLFGGEGSAVYLLSMPSNEVVPLTVDLRPRIKAINVISHCLIVLSSSDGTIALYRLEASRRSLVCLSAKKSELRITCSTHSKGE